MPVPAAQLLAPNPHTPGSPRPVTPAPAIAAALASLDGSWSIERTRRMLLQRRWTWARADITLADVSVDAEVARRWLPPALALPAAAAATVFVADYPDTAMGFSYREAGVLLHARLRGAPVLHCAWMVVDDDTALILGRELLGFPKKLAAIDLDFAGPSARASVVRRGVEVLALEARIEGAPVDRVGDPRAFPHPIVNVRGVPGAAPSLLVGMAPNERCHESRPMRVAIGSRRSACDPIADLGIAGEHPGRHLIVDLAHPDAPDATRVPAWPAAIASPTWLWKAYPFRAW